MKTEHGLTISLSNSKLGSFIPTINLPPIITCRCGAPCAKGCYGLRGNHRFENVKKSQRENLAIFENSPEQYFADIDSFLKNGLTIYKYFRFHSTGDIVNDDYFCKMVELAKANELTRFLCFTKKFEIVNNYIKNNGALPNNLRVIFSAWDRLFKVENPYNMPVAYVNFKDTAKNPVISELAIPCTGNCENCLACWSLQKGQSVVFNQH
jgi:hypothetical protein